MHAELMVEPCISVLLRDDDVRRRDEHRDGRDDGERRERQQTDSVQHHGRELPVVLDGRSVLVVADLVRDHAQFFQDQAELPEGTGRKAAAIVPVARRRTVHAGQ